MGRFSTAFGQCYELICSDILKHIDVPAYPTDLNAVDLVAVAQSEVKAHAVMALVPATAVDFVYKS